MIAPVSRSDHGGVDAASVPLETLANRKDVSEEAKVAEASRQFEAILVRQILAEADKSAGGKGSDQGVYQQMFNDHLADTVTRSGGFGLARSLQEEFRRQHHAVSDPAPDESSTASAPAVGRSVSRNL